jgi:hypothetical protein
MLKRFLLIPLIPAAQVALGNPTTLTFDGIGSLAAYAPLGITFSGNASIWTNSSPSVLDDPHGGAYTVPSALQFGSANETGSLYLATPANYVSVWALSGPGPDPLNVGVAIRAYDDSNQLIGEDLANSILEFDFVSHCRSRNSPGRVRHLAQWTI